MVQSSLVALFKSQNFIYIKKFIKEKEQLKNQPILELGKKTQIHH